METLVLLFHHLDHGLSFLGFLSLLIEVLLTLIEFLLDLSITLIGSMEPGRVSIEALVHIVLKCWLLLEVLIVIDERHLLSLALMLLISLSWSTKC